MGSRVRAYVMVICLLAFAAPGWTQTQITTGVIEGSD